MSEIIGIIGGLIIIIAWIMETIEALKRHKSVVDLKFAFAFILAAIFLTVYSWERADTVFFWINIVLLVILSLEIWISIHVKKVHRRKK